MVGAIVNGFSWTVVILLYQGDSSCFFAFVKIYTIPVGFLIFWGRHGDSFPPGKSQDDKDAGMEKSGKC